MFVYTTGLTLKEVELLDQWCHNVTVRKYLVQDTHSNPPPYTVALLAGMLCLLWFCWYSYFTPLLAGDVEMLEIHLSVSILLQLV